MVAMGEAGFRPQAYSGPTLVVPARSMPRPSGPTSWSPHLTGDVATNTVPGNYFGIPLEPSVAEIGERLAAAAVAWES